MLVPEDEGEEDVKSSEHLIGAIKTILIADLVNEPGQTSSPWRRWRRQHPAAGPRAAISIRWWSSARPCWMKVMERYPVIITVGAALIAMSRGDAW